MLTSSRQLASVLDSINYEVRHFFISDIHAHFIVDLRTLRLLCAGKHCLSTMPDDKLRASDRAGDDSTKIECRKGFVL
jgi:hypothetical protein